MQLTKPYLLTVFLLVLAIGLVASTTPSATAEVAGRAAPLGSDFLVSGPQATENDSAPSVAWNSTTGEYLVVWADSRDILGRGFDIYGQRMSASGDRLGGDFRISGPNATADEDSPVLAYNATANEFLIVWEDCRRGCSTGLDIYARRVSASGQLLGSETRVNPLSKRGEDPAVAWSDQINEYLVVWATGNWLADPPYYAIRAQRVAADGSRAGKTHKVAAGTDERAQPAIAWNATSGEYLVVWRDARNIDARGWDIYSRRLSPKGAQVAKARRVSGHDATSLEASPAVAWSRTANRYLVVWQDNREDATRRWDIYARRVTASGRARGADLLVGSYTHSFDWDNPYIYNDLDPAVVWNATTNRYLVVWENYVHFTYRAGDDIYGREVSPRPRLLGDEFRISSDEANYHDYSPAVAWGEGGNRYLVVWEDYRNGHIGSELNRGADIYGRLVSG